MIDVGEIWARMEAGWVGGRLNSDFPVSSSSAVKKPGFFLLVTLVHSSVYELCVFCWCGCWLLLHASERSQH